MIGIQSPRRGFTLVEVLLVIVILGILASIVVPQYSSGAQEARQASLRQQLHNIRTAIDLFKIEHGGRLPDLTANWDELTLRSSHLGRTVGPYLASPPANPITSNAAVFDGPVTSPATSPAGYIYDYNDGNGTGRIVATDASSTAIFQE